MAHSFSRCFKSLSARLLLLTLLWVSFIVVSIGYTMSLNWQLEASAAASKTVGDLRYHTFRTALFAQHVYPEADFASEVAAISQNLELLRRGDRWKPLSLPPTKDIQESLEGIELQWNRNLLPDIEHARSMGGSVSMPRVNAFVEQLSSFSDQIEDYRGYYLWQLRYLQGLLIVLAIGSLFAIMGLLLRWVVRPLERLGEGINRLSAGDLSARIANCGEDEIGEIAAGFNHMAGRLKDSYDNLEQKVAEKTASVEEKNSHLAQLYEMTSYFAQQRDLDDMIDGFVTRIMRHTAADACTVQLVNTKEDAMQLVSATGLPADIVKAVNDTAMHDETQLCSVLEKSYPVCFSLEEIDDSLAPLLVKAGFLSAYSFQIRSASGDIGVFTLYFRSSPHLTTQLVRLLESFSTHLGVAIENSSLIERDRQYAVVQERQLLAQGLHDSIAQALSFLNLQVQFLADAIKNDDRALRDESLAAIQTGVQECYEDVRELLLNFRERIHKEGFIEGVRTVISRFEGQSHMLARLRVTGRGPELTPRQKLQVIFIIQEALSNVRKHSHAETVDIRIENNADLRVSITDDGVGIDDKLVAERKGQHVGLSIMAERAKRIGAAVKVERASPIGGTRVTLELKSEARHAA
ncbi:MAG: HAMP domain-containing protein [Sutterella sp.]|nr:HAMP domain-containing protein [Sutterella sp.]